MNLSVHWSQGRGCAQIEFTSVSIWTKQGASKGAEVFKIPRYDVTCQKSIEAASAMWRISNLIMLLSAMFCLSPNFRHGTHPLTKTLLALSLFKYVHYDREVEFQNRRPPRPKHMITRSESNVQVKRLKL